MLPFELFLVTLLSMETLESLSHYLLGNKIKGGTLTLPIDTSVSGLSEQECAEIPSLLRPQIWLPKMTDLSDSLLSLFDPFYSIDDTVQYLLRLSQELQIESYFLEKYTTAYTDGLIEMYKEKSSDIRFVYEETCHHILEDICSFLRGLKYLLSAIYTHRDMAYSVPEAKPLVLQTLNILQLIVDKADDAHFNFADALEYYIYECVLDKTGKWYTTIINNKTRKAEELELEAYEFAFEVIGDFTRWVEENRIVFRLEELGAGLGVFCQIKTKDPEEFARVEAPIKDERVATLLEKDIVKAIIKVLGKERKKRVQIVNETQYEDGGHIGAALIRLKHIGILQHKRPYYWVNPAWYGRLSNYPDKDGQ